MKKLISFLIIAIAALSLAGCDKKEQSKPLEELIIEYINVERGNMINKLNESHYYDSQLKVVNIEYCYFEKYNQYPDDFKVFCYLYFSDGTSYITTAYFHLDYDKELKTWTIKEGLS